MSTQKTIKGTRTEQNLLTSFAGEAQARNRYTYFADKAMEEGYVQIAAIFQETAEQELMHARRFFDSLEGGEATVSYDFPAGMVDTTHANLLAAAEGERHENTTMYPGFAEVAQEEGFSHIAVLWRNVANAERFHERRYVELAENIDKGRVFKRPEKVTWRCRKCGFLHEGVEPPPNCPACLHPKGWYELLGVNW
jgi:rubrerythrin